MLVYININYYHFIRLYIITMNRLLKLKFMVNIYIN